MKELIPTIKDIKKDIYLAFEKEVGKQRQPEQTAKVLEKAKTKDHLVEKLAKELLKKELFYNVGDYVNAQFVALNYMKYLPKIEMITSKNGMTRWEKYKNLYKYIESKNNYVKVVKRRNKNKNNYTQEELLSFKSVLDWEEEDKKLFYNKERGFDFCLSNEIYFNPKSLLCRKCEYKNFCKNVLKAKCLPLYKFRFGLLGEAGYLSKMKKF